MNLNPFTGFGLIRYIYKYILCQKTDAKATCHMSQAQSSQASSPINGPCNRYVNIETAFLLYWSEQVTYEGSS